jgi:tetratricopeptide (TPR) repeat protein
MKIFLSYAAEQRPVAEPLALALEADGHEVFFDRHDLPVGGSYHDRIRDAIDEADRYVFLVSPQSVEPGSYALTELSLAQARWPRPSGRVLPVMAVPTPFEHLPAYLGAVTVLQPKGNLAAEVAAQFARPPWWRRWSWVGAALLVAGGAVAWWTYQQRIEAQQQEQELREAQQRAQAREQDAAQAYAKELQAAIGLCTGGDYASAWSNFDELSARAPSASSKAAAQTAQADCGMVWLRDVSVRDGQTFSSITQKIVPVLGREVAAAQGSRLADLHAHLGWAEYLRWRDGQRTTPAVHYQRAIDVDPQNPYANAMWAHNSVLRRDASADVVAARFEAALASGRETPFVRWMQAVLVDIQGDQLVPVLRSLDQGRKRGEARPRGAESLYRRWCESDLINGYNRPKLFAALPPDDAIATIAWIQPLEALPEERRPLWHLCGSAYLVHAGRHADADAIIKRTLQSMGSAYKGGSYERWAMEQLGRFKGK